MRKKVRIISLLIFSIYTVYAIYYTYTIGIKPSYEDCGIIKSKSEEEVSIKHGIRTDLYLNVMFEKSGFRSINTAATTYFEHQKGDRICFDLDYEMPVWHTIHTIWAVCIVGSALIVCIVLFIGYLIGLEF